MQKIKLDKQTIIFVALSFALIVELSFLLPWSIKRMVRLNKKIGDLKSRLETFRKEWADKENYLSRQKELSWKVQGALDKLIVPGEEPGLLSLVSKRSEDFNVEIQALSPGELIDYPEAKSEKFYYLPLAIKAKSSFHNLALFLDDLQHSKFLFEIKNLRITSRGDVNSAEMILCGLVKMP